MKYLIFAALFFSCNVQTKPYKVLNIAEHATIAKPQIFETAFFNGTKVKVDSATQLTFYSIDIGKINVTSGKIIACDPVTLWGDEPFSQTFPIGQFPVHLAIARFDNDERVAFSRIHFSDKPIVKWEYALVKGQQQTSIFSDSFYGYSVDAGVGLFLDEKAKAEYLKDDDFLEHAINEMSKHAHPTWEYGISEKNNQNIIAFSTGFGDGHYATYIGFDATGQPCQLLTDFGLVPWWSKH